MKKFASLLALFVLLLGLSACGDGETEADVKEKRSDNSSLAGDGRSDDESEEAEQAEESEEGSDGSAEIGDTVGIADWDVTVTDLNLDADEVIAKANQFNDKPKGKYVLVTYEATYTGDERTADAMMDLTWTFTDSESTVHDQVFVWTPGDDLPSEARKGGTVTQMVPFDIPADLVKGGTLTVEGYDESFDKVFADFPIN